MNNELEILKTEYIRTFDEIKLLMESNDKNLGLGITILTGFAIFLPDDKSKEFTLLFPVLIFALFFYGVYTYNNILIMGGYKKYLEEKINKLANSNILIWESELLVKLRNKGLWNWPTWIAYGLFIVGICIYSLQNTFLYYGCTAMWLLFSVIVLLIIILIYSLLVARKQFDRSYNLAKEIENKENDK